MYPPVPQIAFYLGPIAIHYYGITMATAILVGVLLASRYVERFGLPGDSVWNLLLWILIPALIGARLYFVFIQTPWTSAGVGNYIRNPIKIIQVWDGGLHIYGVYIVGGLALLIYMMWKKLPMLIYLDAIGLVLPLSQAIGRLGNFINQELYGPPTTLPWGLRIDVNHRIPPYDNYALYPASTRFQPLFMYEALWNLIGFGLFFYISRRYAKYLKPGDIFLMYLIWYPAIRFLLEFFRTDSWFFPGTHIDTVHILSALMIVIAATALYLRHRTPPAQPDIFIRIGDAIHARYERLIAAAPYLTLPPLTTPALAVAGVGASIAPVATVASGQKAKQRTDGAATATQSPSTSKTAMANAASNAATTATKRVATATATMERPGGGPGGAAKGGNAPRVTRPVVGSGATPPKSSGGASTPRRKKTAKKRR